MSSAPHSPTQSSPLDQRYQFYGNCIALFNQQKTPQKFLTKFLEWSKSYSINENDPCYTAVARIALKELKFSETSQEVKSFLKKVAQDCERLNPEYFRISLIAYRKLHSNALSKDLFQKLESMDIHTQVKMRGHFFREVRAIIDTNAPKAFEEVQIAATKYQIRLDDPLTAALSTLALKRLQPADDRFKQLAREQSGTTSFLAATENPRAPEAFILADRFLQLGI